MKKALTILDGGMGRELQRIGAPFSQPLWSAQALIESPQQVTQAHQNFIDAGADIITVNSYACVPFHLGEALYQSNGADLARQAAEISYQVAKENAVLVAGCIPPALGSYRPDLFESSQAESISRALFNAQDEYVDLWLVETISSMAELTVIHSILNSTNKKCYYAFSLDDEVLNQAKLRSGEAVEEAAEFVCRHGGEGVFFNCSIPEVMEQAIKVSKKVIDSHGLDLEIGVYANNFTPISSGHQANNEISSLRTFTPDDYLKFAQRWYELGATTIGGCCGIRPDHIQALSQWKLEQFN
ncbi:homocysteine S-methyltransferase family protein [Vibrio sp.]|uniref:homocysteine S-methyltransferase family protein n=1 Tax=Vibrio sp. TaxID=678 RepID=UPI003AA93DAB